MAEPIDRRSFLKSAAGGTVALVSLPALAVSSEATGQSCKFFSASQAALVAALAEQIVPADEYPGAHSAGVVFYIDAILAGRYGKFYTPRYEQGLKLVDEISQKQFDLNFVSLPTDQQTSLLQGMESGAAGEAARQFFFLILRHTMEGYYGSLELGGNREKIGWNMLGFGG
jgi:gluconate 2-dehydrogenase gamma chain